MGTVAEMALPRDSALGLLRVIIIILAGRSNLAVFGRVGMPAMYIASQVYGTQRSTLERLSRLLLSFHD